MAIENDDAILASKDFTHDVRLFSQSVSFTTSAGDNSSSRTVPDGETWEVQTVRAFNGEGAALDIIIQIIDPDGFLYGELAQSDVSPVNVPADKSVVWSGSLFLGAGWRIGVKYLAAAGGSSVNWQYIALKYKS